MAKKKEIKFKCSKCGEPAQQTEQDKKNSTQHWGVFTNKCHKCGEPLTVDFEDFYKD